MVRHVFPSLGQYGTFLFSDHPGFHDLYIVGKESVQKNVECKIIVIIRLGKMSPHSRVIHNSGFSKESLVRGGILTVSPSAWLFS